jgi:indolepyruvate ferredoxin oxidoreductase beta subunit
VRYNVLMVGVGGQGVLLASMVIGETAMRKDMGVAMSEVHAFEPIEAYRSLDSANKETYIVTNTHPIIPITVSMGTDEYPDLDSIIEKMRSASSRVIPINATKIATELGGAIATNSVLIGAVAAVRGFPLSAEELMKSLLDRVPEKFREMNERAFQAGYQVAKDIMDGLD